MGLSQDSRKLFVSNLGSDEIIVINTTTFEILDRISVATQPLDMAFSPDGRTLYVTNSGAGALTAIDIHSHEARTMPLTNVGSGPYGIAVSGNGATIYVTDISHAQVVVLDEEGEEVGRIEVPESPRSLALSPDGTRLYVTSFASNILAVIGVPQNQVVNRIPLPVDATFAVAAGPDGQKVYLTAHGEGVLIIIDAIRETVLKELPVGRDPRAISFSPAGDRAFVTNSLSNEIFIVDLQQDTVLGTYIAGSSPRGIALGLPAIPSVATAVQSGALQPAIFELAPPYPNPFNATAAISYSISAVAGEEVQVELAVYNTLGQRVRTLVHEFQGAGVHRVEWDGKDDHGFDSASGAYTVLLHSPGYRTSRKMVLIR